MIFFCEGVSLRDEMTNVIQMMSEAVEETQAALLTLQSINPEHDDEAVLRRSIETARNHLTRSSAKMINVELLIAGYQMPKIGG